MKPGAVSALAFVLALIPSAWLAWSGRDMPQLGRLGDDGVYWVAAKSLAQGSGYRILNLPGQPFETKYPPLYPLLLSAIWRVAPNFPDNLGLATCFSWLLFPVFLLSARKTLAELGLADAHCWILCIFLALNASLILFSLDTMTELIFTSLLLMSLCFAERAARPGSRDRNGTIAGILGGAAYLTRVAAAPLLLTVPVCLLYRRRRPAAFRFLAAMLPAVVGWTIWVKLHKLHTLDLVTLYHTDYFGFHLHNVARTNLLVLLGTNFAGVLSGITGLITANPSGSNWIKAATLPLALLSIAGTVRLLSRAGALQHLLYTTAFLASLMVWHFPPEERYLIPIFPILLGGLMVELKHTGLLIHRCFGIRRLSERLVAGVLIAVLSSTGILCACQMYRALYIYLPSYIQSERRQLAANRAAFHWIERSVPRDAIFLANYDSVVYLYSGHPATRLVAPSFLYYERDRGNLLRYYGDVAGFMREHGISYVLLNPTDLYLTDAPEKSLAVRNRVFGDTSVFECLYDAGQVSIYHLRDSRKTSR